MGDKHDHVPALVAYENVRCLDCGAVYAKPSRGGTERANPGCPDCGYVGWLSASVPLRQPPARGRARGYDRLRRAQSS